MCNRLDKILECDGQTDGRTNILPWHSPRYAYASRNKNKPVTIRNANKSKIPSAMVRGVETDPESVSVKS